MTTSLDIQGHRGCRGLRPENTIPAFIRAIDIGVTTLELDVVVNKHHDVIISHEPFFNHEISTGPNNELIDTSNEKDFNMFPMTMQEIQQFDVGKKPHERFPNQKKVAAIKPTLDEMVKQVELYVFENEYPLPLYNIEIKRNKKHDGIFHPEMTVFADVVCNKVVELGIDERSTIQCFDVETLQYVHKKYPELKLVYLIQNTLPFEKNISNLGFQPFVYSPYFKLVTEDLVNYCRKNNIKLIPWTVNSESDIISMIDIGVDGIISDYPDRVVELSQSKRG
ncbi:MAG: glycerophosphodiester phosphodiesterase family protein [Saprospiraceae bacterium]|nr:glycerophosphodiester phosphodiesterase family protein [Saprospiraceae bacterium]